jgi:hypothetical protein
MQAAAREPIENPPPSPMPPSNTPAESTSSFWGPDVLGGAILAGAVGSVFAGVTGLVGGAIAVPLLHGVLGHLARKERSRAS